MEEKGLSVLFLKNIIIKTWFYIKYLFLRKYTNREGRYFFVKALFRKYKGHPE